MVEPTTSTCSTTTAPGSIPTASISKKYDRQETLRKKHEAALRRDYLKQKKVGFIRTAQLVERRYGVGHPRKLAQQEGIAGVARLIVCPSFSPNTIVMLIYDEKGIRVEAVRDASRHVARISVAEAAYMHLSWPDMLDEARQVESCDTFSLDGVEYFHRVATAKELIHVYWGNPSGAHLRQTRLIDVYSRILRSKPGLAAMCFDGSAKDGRFTSTPSGSGRARLRLRV